MSAWLELVVVGVAAWWLGVCSMALWQNWKARPAPLVPVDLLPQQLVETLLAHNESGGAPISPFAPKPKPSMRKVETPLRARANKLKHWPRAAEAPVTPGDLSASQSLASTEAPEKSGRALLPKVEFGNGVSR